MIKPDQCLRGEQRPPRLLSRACRGVGRFGHGQTASVQKPLSAAYGTAMDLVSESAFCWNWGMHRDDLREELRSKLAGSGRGESDGFSEELYYYALRSTQRDAPRPRRMLEVGCGPGRGLDLIARLEEGSQCVGLDLSPKAIEYAREHCSSSQRVTFVQGDAEALPFADAEFDVVINIESSHNYPHRREIFRGSGACPPTGRLPRLRRQDDCLVQRAGCANSRRSGSGG